MRCRTLFSAGIAVAGALLAAAPVEDTSVAAPDAAKFGPLYRVRKVDDGPSRATGMVSRGKFLYVLGDEMLWIYDTSTPEAPRLTGKTGKFPEGRQIALSGNVACIAARSHGLYLVDIADPAAPEQLARFDTVELATGVDAAGPVCFVAERQYGVECVDISDPEHPRFLSLIQTPEAQSVFYDSGRVFAGDWAAGRITILDVSHVRAPRQIAAHPLTGYGDGVAVRGDLCLASTGHHAKTGPKENRRNNGHSINLIDISNIRKPRTISSFPFPPFFSRGNDFWTVRFSGNTAVAADSHNGVFLVDISDPLQPKGAGQLQLPPVASPAGGTRPDAVSGVAAVDGVLYLSGVRTGLFLAEIPRLRREPERKSVPPVIPPPLPAKPVPGFFTYDAGGRVRGVAIHGDLAWVAAGSAGIHTVRLSEKGISPVAVLPVTEAYDVKYSDGLLYAAEGAAGVAVYRPDEAGRLTLLGRCQFGPLAQLIWKPEGSRFAVVSARTGVLYFLDVSDPARMKKVFQHRQIGLLYGDLLCDRLLGGRYIANNWHSGGLAWYDLSGEKPVLANRVVERLNTHADGLAALNGKLLMINHGRYVLLEPNQPGPSQEWKRYSAGERISGVPTVDGTIVALSHRADREVRLYDFSNPEAARPIPERRWKFPDVPGTVSFWRGRVVIPLSYQGLLLEKALP
ncbi:hypothetical protein [Victivallis vadensis]|uniref:hypothetical protein n=1 Tax=Victivallis vadensis TaxID=172901 RepID=UPI003D016B56